MITSDKIRKCQLAKEEYHSYRKSSEITFASHIDDPTLYKKHNKMTNFYYDLTFKEVQFGEI